MSEDRGRKTDAKRQMPKDRCQRAEDRGLKYEFGMGKSEVGVFRMRISDLKMKLHFPLHDLPHGFEQNRLILLAFNL